MPKHLAMLAATVLLASSVLAQSFPPDLPDQISVIASTNPLCDTTDFKSAPWTRSAFTQYTSGFTGATNVCYIDTAIKACATVDGAVGCNTYNENCVLINSDIKFSDTTVHPEMASNVSAQPSVCASQGAFFHPDAIVFVIVLIIIGWLALVALLVYVVTAFRSLHSGLFLHVILGMSFVLCTLLLFSYYYLNAVLVLGCVYVAYMLFSVRRADCTAFGFLLLLGGMFWTMHAASLGWVQHMSRFSNDATAASVEMCINYYRGYFAYPAILRGDFDNPVINSKEFCRREWLGAELFFMIMLQLVLLLAVVAGAAARSSVAPIRQIKVREAETKEIA